MKENLFEMLLNFFEKSLDKLKDEANDADKVDLTDYPTSSEVPSQFQMMDVKEASRLAERIILDEERLKMTKAAYQFLCRMRQHGVLSAYNFEQVMDQVTLSDARIVNLEEIKWIIHNLLVEEIDERHVSFLDLLLYQKEEQYSVQ